MLLQAKFSKHFQELSAVMQQTMVEYNYSSLSEFWVVKQCCPKATHVLRERTLHSAITPAELKICLILECTCRPSFQSCKLPSFIHFLNLNNPIRLWMGYSYKCFVAFAAFRSFCTGGVYLDRCPNSAEELFNHRSGNSSCLLIGIG